MRFALTRNASADSIRLPAGISAAIFRTRLFVGEARQQEFIDGLAGAVALGVRAKPLALLGSAQPSGGPFPRQKIPGGQYR